MSDVHVREPEAPPLAAAAGGPSSVVAVLLPRKPFWGARIVQVPLLRALRERNPESRILLFAAADGADEFVRWRLGDEVLRVTGRAALPGLLRRERPDVVLNLRRKSTSSCVAAGFSGARRIGFETGPFSLLLDERVPYDSSTYVASRYVSLLEPGARGARDDRTIPLFRAWMDERVERERKGRRATGLEPAGGVVERAVLLPGAGRPEKRWPLARFLALGRALAQDLGERPLLVLGPRERALLEEIPPDSGVEIRDQLEIGALLRLIAAAPLVVANDSGPSHLAQLSGRRFLGLYRAGFSTIEDWFLDKENSDLVATQPGEGMDAIHLEGVLARARALLARPATCDVAVPFSREEARRPRAGKR
jgi:ADP-heptose:LPS heptosyltransferase